jgi:hypothetical protein
LSAVAALAPELRPGRSCPLSYRYSPRVFDRPAEIEAETLYVVGGLYGNVEALRAIEALAADEAVAPAIVFNGDIHRFDHDPRDFAAIDGGVRRHRALRGNVETELARDDGDAGCGCAYPSEVSDAEVERSNAILASLRQTARSLPALRSAYTVLPMHLVARVGDARIGIVHGDATSLAGWGFAHDRLDAPSHRRWIESVFDDAKVDAFASTHTCLPAFRDFGVGIVANNGAAGMPNFAGTRHGLVTRIALRAHGGGERRLALRRGAVHVEALRVEYDHARWVERFLASWPPGSAGHASYYRRIVEGPRFAG